MCRVVTHVGCEACTSLVRIERAAFERGEVILGEYFDNPGIVDKIKGWAAS
jgi:hypothetical protein